MEAEALGILLVGWIIYWLFWYLPKRALTSLLLFALGPIRLQRRRNLEP